jgi:uncharacterized membrane protein
MRGLLFEEDGAEMRDFELRAAFSKVLEYLHIIDAKVSAMPQVQVQVSSKHLRTVSALVKLGKSATATEVAAVTGCARAHESKILNELAGRGIVTKEKQGRKRIFKVREKL